MDQKVLQTTSRLGRGIRDYRQAPFRTWLVSPAGRVKTIYFHANVQSPLIDVERLERDGRVYGLGMIQLKPYAKRDGWKILEDLYEAEGREDDWAAFMDYQDNIQALNINQVFPSDMYPDALLDMVKADENRKWVPPVSKKKAAETKAAVSKPAKVSK